MDNIKYRDCSDLIKTLKEDEYGKRLIDSVKKDEELFWGIRNEVLNVYCCGASIAKIYMDKTEIVADIHNRFVPNDIKGLKIEKKEVDEEEDSKKIKSTYLKFQFKVFVDNLNNINIKAAETYWQQGRYEKICQQWIVNNINHDADNKWFCIDMEYNTQGKNLGRFDIIAVSKQRDETTGKFKVYLIELKVGEDSYDSSWYKKESIFKKKKINPKYVNQKEKLQGDAEALHKLEKNAKKYKEILSSETALFEKDYEELNYGSGIVGHITDYLRFLANQDYYVQLSKNVIQMIKCMKELNMENIPEIEKEDELSEKPEILILSYDAFNLNALPKCGINMEKNTKWSGEKWPDKSELKRKMKTVLFSKGIKGIRRVSEYNMQDAINENYISEFLKLDINDEEDTYEIAQNVKGKGFKFIIRFVDQSEENSWNCIKG